MVKEKEHTEVKVKIKKGNQNGDDEVALHGEIRKLGEKRSRTEINVMLKEGTCRNKIGENKDMLLAMK